MMMVRQCHSVTYRYVITLSFTVPVVRGQSVSEFEDKSSVRVCVNLEGSTATTSQPIAITFTPGAKTVVSPNQAATRAYTIIVLFFSIIHSNYSW